MRRLGPLLRSPEGVAYLVLAVFTLTSVLGYWNFALHPERLPASPGAVKFFAVSFQFFAQLHIVLAFVVLALLLVRFVGWRWVLALGAVYALSFTSEHVGTGYGIPFGGYSYTGLLGLKVGGRVPALIPLSWFLMALPSWVMARAATASLSSPLPRLALGAFWLTVWDLALDPAMSFLTPYWVWEDTGPYYGMPWLNLAGWFVTGLVLMAALDVLARRARLESVSTGWATAYYFLILALPTGMVLAAGLWPAVLVTLAGVAVAGGITVFARGASSPAGVVGAPSTAGAR